MRMVAPAQRRGIGSVVFQWRKGVPKQNLLQDPGAVESPDSAEVPPLWTSTTTTSCQVKMASNGIKWRFPKSWGYPSNHPF